MIKPIEKSKIEELFKVVKYILLGVLITLSVLAVLFLKTHWKGFNKFLSDPAFFDNIEVTREFSVKK